MEECVHNSPLSTTLCQLAPHTLSVHPRCVPLPLHLLVWSGFFRVHHVLSLSTSLPREALSNGLRKPPELRHESATGPWRPNPIFCSCVSLSPCLDLPISPLSCRCVGAIVQARRVECAFERSDGVRGGHPPPVLGGVATSECDESCAHTVLRQCAGAYTVAKGRLPFVAAALCTVYIGACSA